MIRYAVLTTIAASGLSLAVFSSPIQAQDQDTGLAQSRRAVPRCWPWCPYWVAHAA